MRNNILTIIGLLATISALNTRNSDDQDFQNVISELHEENNVTRAMLKRKAIEINIIHGFLSNTSSIPAFVVEQLQSDLHKTYAKIREYEEQITNRKKLIGQKGAQIRKLMTACKAAEDAIKKYGCPRVVGVSHEFDKGLERCHTGFFENKKNPRYPRVSQCHLEQKQKPQARGHYKSASR